MLGTLVTATRNCGFQSELKFLSVGTTCPGGLLEPVEPLPQILEGLKFFGPDLHTVGNSLNPLHPLLKL